MIISILPASVNYFLKISVTAMILDMSSKLVRKLVGYTKHIWDDVMK